MTDKLGLRPLTHSRQITMNWMTKNHNDDNDIAADKTVTLIRYHLLQITTLSPTIIYLNQNIHQIIRAVNEVIALKVTQLNLECFGTHPTRNNQEEYIQSKIKFVVTVR